VTIEFARAARGTLNAFRSDLRSPANCELAELLWLIALMHACAGKQSADPGNVDRNEIRCRRHSASILLWTAFVQASILVPSKPRWEPREPYRAVRFRSAGKKSSPEQKEDNRLVGWEYGWGFEISGPPNPQPSEQRIAASQKRPRSPMHSRRRKAGVDPIRKRAGAAAPAGVLKPSVVYWIRLDQRPQTRPSMLIVSGDGSYTTRDVVRVCRSEPFNGRIP